MTALLDVRSVTKRFGGVAACSEVSVQIQPGEVVGVVGESGSGKSTMANIALGLLRPDAGEVQFQGRRLEDWLGKDRISFRACVQGVFQQPMAALDSRRTIGWSVAEPMVIHKVGTRRSRAERVAELLDSVGLHPALAERRPHQLSGGQAQRANIARALALSPKLLICDEPVSALDVSVQAQVLNLLTDIRERLGVGMLFISHDLAVVRHMCDRLVVMYAGRVVESGGTDAVRDRPAHPYTRALLAAALEPTAETAERAKIGSGTVDAPPPPREALPARGCRFAPRCPFVQEACRVTEPPLVEPGNGRTSACLRVAELPPMDARPTDPTTLAKEVRSA